MRWIQRLTLATIVATICWVVLSLPVGAYEPRNVRHYPGVSAAWPMGQKVASTGTLTWSVSDQYGYPEWKQVVRQSLDSDSSDALSLARVLNGFLASEGRGQITIREARVGEAPDMTHYAVSAAFMEAKCGAAWATACVYLSVALPVPAYYKAASLILWGYPGAAPVVRHETFHTLARACDQYRAGCPLVSTGLWESEVVCTGNPDTLMDCGGAARTATSYDYETFKTAYPPSTQFLQVVNEWGPCEPYGGCWNSKFQLWVWVIGPTVWVWDPRNHDFGPYRGWFCTEGCP